MPFIWNCRGKRSSSQKQTDHKIYSKRVMPAEARRTKVPRLPWEVFMKTIALMIAAVSIVFCFGSVADAAGRTSKPSLESCKQLANQRGVMSGGYNANRARRDFVVNCMKGKQN